MGDQELRRILLNVIREIDNRKVVVTPPGSSLFRRYLGPGLLAASMSLGLAGCDDRSAGTNFDRGPDGDMAAFYDADLPDAGPPDTSVPELPDASFQDVEIDSGGVYLYMGPPPIEPDDNP